MRALASLRHEGILGCHNAWIEKPPKGWQRQSDRTLLQDLGNEQVNSLIILIFGAVDSGISLSFRKLTAIQITLCKGTLAE
ncbi:hypothetical protein PENTCL1PPCAC_8617, partial [Pristionchus entomophagus]